MRAFAPSVPTLMSLAAPSATSARFTLATDANARRGASGDKASPTVSSTCVTSLDAKASASSSFPNTASNEPSGLIGTSATSPDQSGSAADAES